MKGERKLRLVTGRDGGSAPGRDGGSAPGRDGGSAPKPPPRDGGFAPKPPPRDGGFAPTEPLRDEPPFTDEEVAAAAGLREALDAGAEPLAIELQAAHVPGPLAPADLDAIVSRALGDDAAATRAERAAAERLRAELQGEGETPKPPARPVSAEIEILRALALAAHPTDLPAERHAALIDAALSRAAFLRRRVAARRIAPVTMAALVSAAAIAAGTAIFVGRVPSGPGAAVASWAHERSADSLFDAATPFPRRGEESARIDRIASARAADLRQNRFAAWGVK